MIFFVGSADVLLSVCSLKSAMLSQLAPESQESDEDVNFGAYFSQYATQSHVGKSSR